MTWPGQRSTLDCQACGKIMRVLSPEEAQKVAENPYRYVVYCNEYLEMVVEPEYR